jgi:hypothetical protein
MLKLKNMTGIFIWNLLHFHLKANANSTSFQQHNARLDTRTTLYFTVLLTSRIFGRFKIFLNEFLMRRVLVFYFHLEERNISHRSSHFVVFRLTVLFDMWTYQNEHNMLLNFPPCLSILLLQTSKTHNNALDIDAIYNLKLRKA